MKNINFIIIAAFLIYSVTFGTSFSQNYYNCDFDDETETPSSLIGGNHKPERTDGYSGTNEDSYFPVLVVFVQYATGEPYTNDVNWPAGGSPTFLNSVIASTRNNSYPNGEWWNAYSESSARLSDYWMEVSRGHFHVLGNAYSITLPKSASDYARLFGANATKKINDDIYAALGQVIPVQDWPFYDRWSKSGNTFVYTPDGWIDMIYIVHRSWANVGGMPAGGIACLGESYSSGENYTIPNTGLKIRGYTYHVDEYGSGLRMTPGSGGGNPSAPMDFKGTISFSEHEHGHYLWGGGHACYGKMSGADADFGVDEYLSPWESIKLGYMSPNIVNYQESEFSIGDYSSRNGSSVGEVLQVPISGSNEFFLIANRQKTSSYDKIMWGDTVRGNPYFNLDQQDHYGKGIYIYHTPSEYDWTPTMDQECADGLWNWEYNGLDYHPDWSDQQFVPFFERKTPVYAYNDQSNYEYNWNTLIPNKDGKDVNRYWLEGGTPKIYTCWLGLGKKEAILHTPGTDRVYTNVSEPMTSRENGGDRWDAWRVGYNQVFSPYSSPSTVSWNSSQTGIFIYLQSMTGNSANLKIYKVGQGGWDLTAILAATPPSKPMLYRPVELFNCNGTYAFPRITWDNNLEPDMLRSGGANGFKRYRIYRAVSSYLNIAPTNYVYIGTYDDYTPYDTANFIDNDPYGGVTINCSIFGGSTDSDHWRYKIVAVDSYNSESVPSDFVSTLGTWISAPEERPGDTELPTSFSLSQNYPNPFNPSTQIKFALPQNSFVTVKVYNALGEEVARLVNNEFRSAGSYSVTFDGSNFGSGIYFYSIEAGQFKETKKMVLIK